MRTINKYANGSQLVWFKSGLGGGGTSSPPPHRGAAAAKGDGGGGGMIFKVKYYPTYSTKYFKVENSPPVNVFQQVGTYCNMSQQVLTSSNRFQQVRTDCAMFQRVGPPNMDTTRMFLDFFVKKR